MIVTPIICCSFKPAKGQDYKLMNEWQLISRMDSLEQIAPIFCDGIDLTFPNPFLCDSDECEKFTNFYNLLPGLVAEVSLYQYRKEFNYNDSIIIHTPPVWTYSYSIETPPFWGRGRHDYDSIAAEVDARNQTNIDIVEKHIKYNHYLAMDDVQKLKSYNCPVARIKSMLNINSERKITFLVFLTIKGDNEKIINIDNGFEKVNAVKFVYEFTLPETFNSAKNNIEEFDGDYIKTILYYEDDEETKRKFFYDIFVEHFVPYAPWELTNISKEYFDSNKVDNF